jgi:hypothetical protein
MGIELVTPHLIEEAVAPIVQCSLVGGAARADAFLGTAFFVDETGVFLTAGHVVKDFALGRTAICVKPDPVKQPSLNAWAWVQSVELAPNGVDVAVGKINFATKCYYDVGGFAEGFFLDVSTCGYPESAIDRRDMRFSLPMRGMKGHIQREIRDPSALGLSFRGCSFELSFPIPRGMSGSPLTTVRHGTLELIGICTASMTSELVDSQHLEVDDGGAKYSERTVKVEQTGIAVSLKAIVDWAPAIGGQSLGKHFGLAT